MVKHIRSKNILINSGKDIQINKFTTDNCKNIKLNYENNSRNNVRKLDYLYNINTYTINDNKINSIKNNEKRSKILEDKIDIIEIKTKNSSDFINEKQTNLKLNTKENYNKNKNYDEINNSLYIVENKIDCRNEVTLSIKSKDKNNNNIEKIKNKYLLDKLEKELSKPTSRNKKNIKIDNFN